MEALSDDEKAMIKQFQCPGCVCGSDTTCDDVKIERADYFRCTGHVLGTCINLTFHVALGMPRGFDRPGGWRNSVMTGRREDDTQPLIRLWRDGKHPDWDRLNVPVWAMDGKGQAGSVADTLYVRTMMPRIGCLAVDVIDKGSRQNLCPEAIDVGEFVEEID